MKKIVLLSIMLLLVFVNVSAQDTVKVDPQTQLTLNRVYEDVKEGIAGLATALKAPAEHVYEILVRQQVVYAWSSLALTIVGIALALLGFYAWSKDWEDFGIFLTIIGTITCLCGLIFFFAMGIGGFINPEYGAIKDIIHFVK